MRWLLDWLERRSAASTLNVILALFVLASAASYLLPSMFPIVILYLPAIALGAWLGGRRAGVALTVVALLTWYTLDAASASSGVLWHGFSQFAIYLIIALMVSAFRASYRRERERSRVDPLTGLLNRTGFNERAAAELERSRRYRHPLSFIYIDVDNFKAVNDTRGHAAGDALLHSVGFTLKQHLRQSDIAARIGGDEFALLLSETDEPGAKAAADELRQQLSRIAGEAKLPVAVSFSIGVAGHSVAPPDVQTALHRADELMYAAKLAGKNRVVSAHY